MAKHTVDFNVDGYKARTDRSGVPDGRYLVRVHGAEDKATRSGGVGIAMVLRVVEDQDGGAWKGANLDHFLNVPRGPAEEDNERTAERIFAETWKAIEPNAKGSTFDTDDWIGTTVVVTVKNKKEPWIRKDAFGFDVTTMVEKSRIGMFFPASEWRIKAKASTPASISESVSGSIAKTDAKPVPAGGDADMDVDL